MIRRSIAVSVIYAVGLLSSFANQAAIAFYFGKGSDVDLYFASLAIAAFVAGLVNAVLSFGLPAMLVDFAADKAIGLEDRVTATSILWLLIIIGTALGLLFLSNIHLGAYPQWFAIAETDGKSKLFQHLVFLSWACNWVNLILAYLSTLASLRRHQLVGGIGYALPSIFSIGAIVLYHEEGLTAALCGQLVGLTVCLPLLFFISRALWTTDIRLGKWITIILAFFKNAPWYLGATLCFTAYPLVDAYLTAFLNPGEFSSLAYSQRIIVAAINLIIAGPSVLLIKRLCASSVVRSADHAQIELLESVRMVMTFLAPIAIFCNVFSDQIIHYLFQRGHFDRDSVDQTSAVFASMAPGMIFTGGSVILSRGLVALGKPRLATLISSSWILLYVLISAILSHRFQAQGIAWAYTAAWTVVTVTALSYLSVSSATTRMTVLRRWVPLLTSAISTFALADLAHRNIQQFGGSDFLLISQGAVIVFVAYAALTYFTGAIERPALSRIV